jgi:hypothetical protein
MDISAVFMPLLGHVAGVPVEETLPGVLAIGAVGARLATEWVRRHFRFRPARDKRAANGGPPG